MTRMTVAEAKKLGLLDEPTKKKRTTRKAAPRDGAVTICATCKATFTTDAAEQRHMNEHRHFRYEIPIETETG